MEKGGGFQPGQCECLGFSLHSYLLFSKVGSSKQIEHVRWDEAGIWYLIGAACMDTSC